MKVITDVKTGEIIQDWEGDLHELDPHGSALYTVIASKCLGKKQASNRMVNWTEGVEVSRKYNAISNTGNTVNFTAGQARTLIKDDMLWDFNDKYYRVTATPTSGSNTATLIQISNIANSDGFSNAEISLPASNFANTELFKYSTAKPEGSKDGESYVESLDDFRNVVTTFEDFAEVSETLAEEQWQLTKYSHREYERAEKLKKHKKDINMQLYIGKGFDHETRQMNKGFLGFNVNVEDSYIYSTGGAFHADLDYFDDFIYNVVKGQSTAKNMYVVHNKAYLLYIRALVRSSTHMTFNPFVQEDKFGMKIKELTHDYGDFSLVEDHCASEMFPNHAVAVYLDPAHVGLRHLKNKDTKVKLGVQPDKDHCYQDQVYTIGGCLQLIRPKKHTFHKLRRKQ